MAPLDIQALEARWTTVKAPCSYGGDDTEGVQLALNAAADIHALLAHCRDVRAALHVGVELSMSNQRAAVMRHALWDWGKRAEDVLAAAADGDAS